MELRSPLGADVSPHMDCDLLVAPGELGELGVQPEALRARKHFDARFFVAAVPPGREPVHDEHETTESKWLAPAATLQEYWERRISIVSV